tara:strand:- start:1118 stop:1354 length:237 start_codon:yes stop_codon:yes gene_type:complete
MTKTQLFCGNILFKTLGVYALVVFGYGGYYFCYGINISRQLPTIGENYFIFGTQLILLACFGALVSIAGNSITKYIAK